MIYTAVRGDIDPVRTDIKCFVDYDKFKEERRNAKIYKILSHLYDPDEYSVYIDANIFLKHPIETYIELLGDADIACFPHPERDCLFHEAIVCKAWGKDDPEIIEKQEARYKDFPKNKGLWACGLIIRRHTDRIKRLNEQWWAEICRGSCRDQISFPYVFSDVVKTLPKVNLRDNEYFKRYGHQT